MLCGRFPFVGDSHLEKLHSIIACNYDIEANTDDGSCIYSEIYYDCSGNCLSDFDGDNICDPLEILGCTNENFIEYDELATEDNNSCLTDLVCVFSIENLLAH